MSGLSLRISNQLMEDQRLGKPVAMTSGFFTSRGPQGELDLFHVVTGGPAAGRVRNLQRDPKSSTGWQQVDLEHRFDASHIASCVDPDPGSRRHIVFASADNEFAIDLYYAVETAPGIWSDWKTLQASHYAPDEQVLKALAAEVIAGKLHLFAITGPRPGKPGRPNQLWQIAWKSEKPEWTRLCETAGDFVSYAKLHGVGEGLLTSVESQTVGDVGVDLVHINVATGATKTIAANLGFRLIDVEEKRNRTSVIVFDQAGETGAKPLRYIDGDDPNFRAVELAGTERLRVRQILAVDGEQLPLAVYILDERNFLHVITRRGDGWEPRMNLGFRFSEVSGGLNSDGLPEIYGLTPAPERRLECLYKSSENDGAGAAWRRQTLSLPAPALEVRPVYTTELLVCDASGLPLALKPVFILANEHMEATANGVPTVFGPTGGVEVTTDGSGRIVLTAGCSALHMAKWRVQESAAANAAGEWIDVNDAVVKRFKTVTLQEVERMIPSDLRPKAKSVHEAVTRAAGIITASSLASTTRAPNGFRFLADDVPQVAWSFSVSGNDVVFSTLTAEESARMQASMLAGADVTLDLFRWFSDAAQAIANQVAQVTRIFVEGGKALFELIVDGVTFVFQGVLKFVEQVFQVIESVWNSVRVGFGKLFEFLGALLENFRQDIWATKTFVSKAIYDGIDSVDWLLAQSRDGMKRFFDERKAEIDRHFDKVLTQLGTTKFDYHGIVPSARRGRKFPEELMLDGAALINAIPRKVLEGLGSMQLPDSIRKPLEGMGTDLETFANTLQRELPGAPAVFNRFKEWVERVAANPQALLQATLREIVVTLRDLLKMMLGVTQASIDLLLSLIKRLFGLLRGILTTKIELPLLQRIYDSVNPEAAKTPLTIGDLLFFACAVPLSTAAFVLTGKGFMRKAGSAHTQEEPLFGDADVSNDAVVRVRMFGSGILRLTLLAPIDAVRVYAPPLSLSESFVGSLIPLGIALMVVPPTIQAWTKWEDIFANVHWIVSSVPPAWGVLTCWAFTPPLSAAFAGVASFLAMHGRAVGVARMIFEIIKGNVDWRKALDFLAWLVSPLPIEITPLKLGGPKLQAAALVVKLVGHSVVAGVLCVLYFPKDPHNAAFASAIATMKGE